jgi:hypothetical protein
MHGIFKRADGRNRPDFMPLSPRAHKRERPIGESRTRPSIAPRFTDTTSRKVVACMLLTGVIVVAAGSVTASILMQGEDGGAVERYKQATAGYFRSVPDVSTAEVVVPFSYTPDLTTTNFEKNTGAHGKRRFFEQRIHRR